MHSSSPTLCLLFLKNYPIYQQLQLEEALLRADQRNWCIINEGTPPAIVMGISGKVDALLDKERIIKKPIPVIRRFSGGGTVVVDEETHFVTFICNSEAMQVAAFPEKIYRWTEKIYQDVFSHLPFCLIENDYALNQKKFGGNAQYLRKDRWLHHSSLLWSFDPKRMEYLLLPQKTPQYRQKRDHGEFLCSLKGHFETKEHFHEKIISVLQERFKVEEIKSEVLQGLLERPHRKATTWVDLGV